LGIRRPVVLTVESILSKTYTPRDLWETLERLTQLELAIHRHQAEVVNVCEADKKLWEILRKRVYRL